MIRICRYCDQEIADPDEAVAVAHELGNSGPGWTVWAHREHAHLANVIDSTLLNIMLRLWVAQMQG